MESRKAFIWIPGSYFGCFQASELGCIHCPSQHNRFPHNSQMGREIRSFEQGVFLNAGFAIRPQLWPGACKYGAMALNLTAASPQDKSLTRCDFAVAHLGYDDIPPIKCVLGQLVFYCSKIGNKLAPNAAPGLFAGWRLEPGCSYKGVGLVLDLAKLKNRSGAWTDPLPVPEQEIYVKDDVPGFPLKHTSEIALSRLGFDEVVMPDPLPLPFSTADVIRKKARRVYVTHARCLELRPTPECSTCENFRSNRSAECIARFEAASGGDKGAPPTPALHRIPPTPSPDTLRLVLIWTLSKRFRLTVDFHQPDPVIHNLMLLKRRMAFRQWLRSLVQMMKELHLLWLHPCIDSNFLELSSCTNLLAILTLCWVKLVRLVVFRLFVRAVVTLICPMTRRLISCWIKCRQLLEHQLTVRLSAHHGPHGRI